MDYIELSRELKGPNSQEAEKIILSRNPTDYEMPGPSYEEMLKTSDLPEEESEVIDDEFRLAYGSLSDFYCRAALMDSKIPRTRSYAIDRLSQIPELLVYGYSGSPRYEKYKDDIQDSVLDKFYIPQIPLLFLDYPWTKDKNNSTVVLTGAIYIVPIMYNIVMSKKRREKMSNAFIEKEGVSRDDVVNLFDYADELIKDEVKQRNHINEWFKKSVKDLQE